VTVLPDILTNAGWLCYLEWVQGLPMCFGMSSVNREMEALMVQAYHQVTQESKARQVPRRLAVTHWA